MGDLGFDPEEYRATLKEYPAGEPEFVPGVLIVKFTATAPAPRMEKKDGIAVTGISSVDALNKRFGVRAVQRVYGESSENQEGLESDIFGLERVYRFEVPREADIVATAAEYRRDPNIESAQPKRFPVPEPGLRMMPGQFMVQLKKDVPAPRIEVSDGIATTGITSLDELNRKFGVRSVERVFTEKESQSAGEKRKKALDLFGVLRLYRFNVSENADILSIIREYQSDPSVETAIPSYSAGK